MTLARGQLCASRSQLAEAWGWSPSAVERFLTRLQTEQMIGREAGQGRTVITICNYEKYQALNDEAGQDAEQPREQRPDSHRTAKEQGNQETKEKIPSPDGDGRVAPEPLALDFAKCIFTTGVTILKACGHDERQARSIIGRWKKTYSEGALIAVLARCQIVQPQAPVEWITKALQVEQQRAAGQAPQAQRPSRASVREIGMRLAADTGQPEQQRIAISGR